MRQAPVFRHLRALRKSPWKFIIWMNELLLHCMLLVSYIQQYFKTSITVLTNQVWKLLIALAVQSAKYWCSYGNLNLKCAFWIKIRKTVFWTVCTPNYIAMRHLKCTFQMTVRRCFQVMHLANHAAKSPYECPDL